MRPATEAEKAYAAGFFDGEGSVSIESRRLKGLSTISWRISVKISQDVREPLELLQEIWGGSIMQRPRRANGKVGFQWACHTRNADRFMRDIASFALVKRREILLAIEYRDGVLTDKRPGRRGISQEETDRRMLLQDKIKASSRWSNSARFSRSQK